MAMGDGIRVTVALIRLGAKVALAKKWWEDGSEKRHDPEWVGEQAGTRVVAFLERAIANPVRGAKGAPPPRAWYTEACKKYFLPNARILSYLITWGELAIAVGLLIPKVDRLAALASVVMNLLFIWGGVISNNAEMTVAGSLVAFGPGLKSRVESRKSRVGGSGTRDL